jgi:hypothetical protein
VTNPHPQGARRCRPDLTLSPPTIVFGVIFGHVRFHLVQRQPLTAEVAAKLKIVVVDLVGVLILVVAQLVDKQDVVSDMRVAFPANLAPMCACDGLHGLTHERVDEFAGTVHSRTARTSHRCEHPA